MAFNFFPAKDSTCISQMCLDKGKGKARPPFLRRAPRCTMGEPWAGAPLSWSRAVDGRGKTRGRAPGVHAPFRCRRRDPARRSAPPRAPGQDRTLGRVRGVLGGAAAHQYGHRYSPTVARAIGPPRNRDPPRRSRAGAGEG